MTSKHGLKGTFPWQSGPRRPDTPINKLPRRLVAKAKIAILSPAWGGAGRLPDRFARGIDALRCLRYQPIAMKSCLGIADGARHWVSASAEQRVEDLHVAFADPEIDCIMASIGGNHSSELISLLDYRLINRNPKIFVGYSDITVLHHAIYVETGLVTFYGPALIPEFGEIGGPDIEVVEHFQAMLGTPAAYGVLPAVKWQAWGPRQSADKQGQPRQRGPGEVRRQLRPGEAEGYSLIGCLPSLRLLAGTQWWPDFTDRILMMEVPGGEYSLADADSDLQWLHNSRVLNSIGGLVVGRIEGWSSSQIDLFHAMIKDRTCGANYPVLSGVEFGHSAPIYTIPNATKSTRLRTEHHCARIGGSVTVSCSSAPRVVAGAASAIILSSIERLNMHC